MGVWTPETTTGRPGKAESERSIIRSYLLMRVVIGAIGLALPIVLILGDAIVLRSDLSARGSLSAYYHSGMRDVFVGALSVAGVFMLCYKLFQRTLDNTLTLVGGVAAIGVAMFPTNLPVGSELDPTPLQFRFGEGEAAAVHYGSAVVFISSLAVLSYYFGVREGNRTQAREGHLARFSPTFWRRFHVACAGSIVAAMAFIVVTQVTNTFDERSILIGEIVALLAFGASWFTKGLELDILLGRRSTAVAEAA